MPRATKFKKKMSITTKGRYALMSLIYLAQKVHLGIKNPIALADIAANQEIDLRYLEQIFASLRKAGLVFASRGPKGGYNLTNDPANISLFDILSVFGENMNMTRCSNVNEGCVKKKRCNSHDTWAWLSDRINDLYKTITLEDICRGDISNYLVIKNAQYIS